MGKLLEDHLQVVRQANALRTDLPVYFGSTLEVTGNATFAGNISLTGDLTLDDATINDDLAITGDLSITEILTRYKRNVLASSGNTTMTTAMSGSVMLLDGAATDYVLPAIGAGDVGMQFDFVSTIISTSQTITAGAADLLTGSIAIIDAGATGSDTFAPDVTDDLVISLNGTTTGGVAVGSWCRLTAISATRWFVEGVFNGSGTLATPFS